MINIPTKVEITMRCGEQVMKITTAHVESIEMEHGPDFIGGGSAPEITTITLKVPTEEIMTTYRKNVNSRGTELLEKIKRKLDG